MKKLVDFQKIDRNFAFDGQLGAIFSPEKTVFRVWSPNAESTVLNLYRDSTSDKPYSTIEMSLDNGVWSAEVTGDLHGVYYTYTISIDGTSNETIDIYAQSAGANGIRGMVIDMKRTNPDGWENTSPVELADYTDAVLYELHVRDFSADESGNFKVRGKFKSFCEKNVTNAFNETIGLEYIAKLGVTHIHLLPVFDYQTIDETSSAPQFNWGYDPLNYNLLEGSYSTNAADGLTRVREFKELIQAAHKLGLGIIMDVVYNHTYASVDSPFNKTFPDYYYRHNPDGTLSDGSACGNEFASERAMAQKFICDSLCMWAEEYKLDGFRFDLMGLLDIDTLNLCADKLKRINPSIILYGEGWTANESPLRENRRAMKKNAVKVPSFAMFSDDFRDGLKGSVFIDTDCGFINGNAGKSTAELMKSLICAGVYRPDVKRGKKKIWTDRPQQTVNYVEAHDNLTLYDKLRTASPEASEDEIEAMDRFAAALIFLSQGVPFIQAGQEMLRTKTDAEGKFVHDSYKSPDSVNSLKWNSITDNKSIVDYYRGLIAVRKKFPQLRMRTGDEIRENIRFDNLSGGAFVMYLDNLIMIVNPLSKPVEHKINGKAAVYVYGQNASDIPLDTAEGLLTAKPQSVTFAEVKK